MKVVPITLKQANAFVIQNHRHHSKVQGCKFCIGAVDDNGELRGVAITGRPVSRYLDDGTTAEITRLCTDGYRNACSLHINFEIPSYKFGYMGTAGGR